MSESNLYYRINDHLGLLFLKSNLQIENVNKIITNNTYVIKLLFFLKPTFLRIFNIHVIWIFQINGGSGLRIRLNTNPYQNTIKSTLSK